MRSLYLSVLVFILCVSANGQHLFNPAPGSYALYPHTFASQGENRDVIWEEDFASGFNGWTSFASGGVAAWEYRGPATIPNNEVGSRGSCVLDNLGEPILSPTAANGFVIFDSNWWDNPDLPCADENLGTGPAPGPHFSTLTSPVIDLTAYGSIALQFNQYLKALSAITRVEVSTDSFNWYPVFTNPNIPNPTPVNDVHVIQISNFLAYQPTARIRFVFDGLYYFWQLDDIKIIDTYSNDLELTSFNYGDFNLTDPTHPTGYEFMQYSKYPTSMAPNLKFSATAVNQGSTLQTDCRLHVDVINAASGTVIHEATSTEGSFAYVGEPVGLRAGNYQMDPILGEYKLAFEATQLETDEEPLNNRDTTYFYIDDVQYARDRIFASAVYLGTPDYTDVEYELGNVFLVTAEDLTCHSITVGVGIGSSTPATIEGRLYRFDIQNGVEADLLGVSQPVQLTSSMLNGYGDQILTNLVFDSPIQVYAGEAYFVAVASTDGVDNFVCAMSGNAEEGTALVRYFPQDWFYLDMLPMVRMNFGPFNTVENNTTPAQPTRAFPNPASDAVTITIPVATKTVLTAQWYNSTGQLVRTERVNADQHSPYISSVSELPAGLYQVMMFDENHRYQTQVVKH
ncbi:MAG: T9SS type A sorting domain-containing protein [Flavobacteriales bacterium]|jgi:hypothetical protein